MNRRHFLALGGASAVAPFGGRALFGQTTARPLPIPPLLDFMAGDERPIALDLLQSQHDFGTGVKSQTFGIGQSYLGPVIKAKSGHDLPFEITNQLDEVSTLHWHGLHIPGDVDGGPHQEIQPGQTWRPVLPVSQRASTNWFHSHTHGRTARQTHMGLAGVMHIEDDASLSADFPNGYGFDDFTLVLQDKQFDDLGRMTYGLTGDVLENGFQGDTLVVNGTVAPVHQMVPSGLVRLRLLNACNARFLKISLSDMQPLHLIASDGGFLASTVETDSIVMSPGERYEILLDMTNQDRIGLQVSLNGNEGQGDLFEGLWQGLWGTNNFVTAIILTRDPLRPGLQASMPNHLANLPVADPLPAVRKREFLLNMGDEADLAAIATSWGNLCGGGVGMGINGRPMKMDHVNFGVKRGQPEIWRIQSEEQLHPFHIHGCSFRILRQNDVPPPVYATGWKDMVSVQGGWSEVLVSFDHEATKTAPYMYHCHILEHEDCGMMGQFTVS